MIALAETEPEVVVAPAAFGADPMLLSVANGTVGLRTGELRPSGRDDLLTVGSDVAFDPDAHAPRWLSFLHWATGEDEEAARYLQRWVGYALTGSTAAQQVLLLVGPGANGKSTFVGAIQRLLGSLAVVTEPELLLAPQRNQGSGHPTSSRRYAGSGWPSRSRASVAGDWPRCGSSS